MLGMLAIIYFIEIYIVHSVLPMPANVYLWLYWSICPSFNHQSIYHGCVPFRIELEMIFGEDAELNLNLQLREKIQLNAKK